MLIGGTPAGKDVPPGSLALVVRRAIDDNPARRYQSPADLLAAIETAVASAQSWEKPEEKGQRLRQRLASADTAAAMDVIRWADEFGPARFIRAFGVFGRALDYGFDWADCDPLANFAHLAVTVTRDREVLRETIRGLAVLGHRHNRWHVRDVALQILQGLRADADASSALEGLQMAGAPSARWTVGDAIIGTLHPVLRTGIPEIGSVPAPPWAISAAADGSW
jgi:hypothetical protein